MNEVIHMGTSCLSEQNSIIDVYHIPRLTYSFLLVSQVTNEWKCLVNFYPDFCVFQDLCTRKERGISNIDGVLYLLANNQEKKVATTINFSTKDNVSKAQIEIDL